MLLYAKLKKSLCGIFTVLFTLFYVIPFLKKCSKSDSIWPLRIGCNGGNNYASKILRVKFLTGTLQVTDQLKWCVMVLFKCFEGFVFSDAMLCSFHLVSTFLPWYILQAECKHLPFNFKKVFVFLVFHLIRKSNLLHVKFWNSSINCFEETSFLEQKGTSTIKTRLAISKNLGGWIMYSFSTISAFSFSKLRMTLSTDFL